MAHTSIQELLESETPSWLFKPGGAGASEMSGESQASGPRWEGNFILMFLLSPSGELLSVGVITNNTTGNKEQWQHKELFTASLVFWGHAVSREVGLYPTPHLTGLSLD